MDQPQKQGLYDPANEHDACGVGFIAHIKGEKRHDIILQGLEILKNLDHRGAVGADPLQGDGAGILIQIPDQLYREAMAKQGVSLPLPGEYGVGMVFMPKEAASRLACEQEIERAVVAEGQVVLGWRDVPVNRDMPMSPTVKAMEPVIRQIFIGRGPDVMVTEALERKLYVVRRRSANAIGALKLKHAKEFYMVSRVDFGVRSFICSRAVRGCVRGVPEEARTVRVERSDDEFRSLGRNTPCASFAEALEQRGFARLPSLREAPASGRPFICSCGADRW